MHYDRKCERNKVSIFVCVGEVDLLNFVQNLFGNQPKLNLQALSRILRVKMLRKNKSNIRKYIKNTS